MLKVSVTNEMKWIGFFVKNNLLWGEIHLIENDFFSISLTKKDSNFSKTVSFVEDQFQSK